MSEHLTDTNVGNIEYIRKQDAVGALADYIKNIDKVYSTGKLTQDDCIDCAESVLDDLSSADVVPVVRCRDCKFYTSMRPDIKTGICDLNIHHMGDDGFCSCGERRGERQ